MKKVIVNIIITALFIACVIFTCSALTDLFVDKQAGNIYQMKAFKEQDENSIDVIFLGSSRVFNDLYPDVFWEKYGIASYDLATPAQPVRSSYYCLREALRTQNPKLVVFEMSQMDIDLPYDDAPEGRFVQNGFRYLKYAFEDRRAGIRPGEEDYFEYPNYLNLMADYHGNYDGATKEDMVYLDFSQYPKTGIKGFKGEVPYTYSEALGPYPEQMTVNDGPLGKRESYYLEKILEITNGAGAQLMLVNSPDHDMMDYPHFAGWAAEHDVPFLNYNYLYAETGINPDEDFIERGHLNRYGGVKFSSHLADYIHENYDIPDHRGEQAYLSYDENAHYEHLLEQNAQLVKITGLGDYFEYFPCKDYLMIVQLVGDYDSYQVGQQSVLSRLGIVGPNYENGGTFVFDGIGSVLLLCQEETFSWHTDIGRRSLEIDVDAESGERSVVIDGVDYAFKPENGKKIVNGLDMVIYDKLNQKVIDSIAFDADNNWAMLR